MFESSRTHLPLVTLLVEKRFRMRAGGMTALTARQVNFYQQNGYLAPIDIFTEDEASLLYTTSRRFENDHGESLLGYGRNNAH